MSFSNSDGLRKTCCWDSVPQDELHAAIQMLDDGGTAIHPVTTIEVVHATDFLDHGPVNMAANGTVQALLTCMVHDGIFKVEDQTDGGLDFALGIAGQGPVTRAFECAAQPGAVNIESDQQVVCLVTQNGDPPVMARDLIELIAMQQQIPAAIRGGMDVLVIHKNVAEQSADVFAYRFVVIARNEHNFLAMSGPAQHLLHKRVLIRRPVDAAAIHGPQINDVAEQEDVLGRIFFQELKEMVRLTRFGTQVDVGQEDRANQLHVLAQSRYRADADRGFMAMHIGFHFFHDERIAWKCFTLVTVKIEAACAAPDCLLSGGDPGTADASWSRPKVPH